MLNAMLETIWLISRRSSGDQLTAGKPGPDAIYGYLTAVFDLVAWWAAENRALELAYQSLRLQSMCPFDAEEPFAAVIRCTADPTKVDKRTRSKWSRMLRYALRYKSHSEPLDQLIKRKGGINSCASRFTRCLERAAA